MRPSHQSSGNAVILVLIGIVLFGALAYTFMRGAKSGQGNLTAQQANLLAQSILDFSRDVGKGVDKLRAKGCSETELNFANSLPVNASQANPNARANNECDLFHANGAGLTPPVPNPSAFDQKWINDPNWNGSFYYWYVSSESYQDIGTSCTQARCADIAVFLGGVNKQLCEAINKQLGHNFSSIPTDSAHCWGQYNGVFGCGGFSPRLRFNTADLRGKRAVCFWDADGYYDFVHVILER